MTIIEPTGEEEIIYIRPTNRGVSLPLDMWIDIEDKYGEGYFKVKIISSITKEEFEKIEREKGQ